MSKHAAKIENKPLAWCPDPRLMARQFPALQWERPAAKLGLGTVHIRTELENRRSRLSLAAVSYSDLPELARQGWIRPLDPWFTRESMAGYAPQAVALSTVDGHLFGIPDDITPFVFFVRANVLKRLRMSPPRTWSEFEVFAARLKAKEHKGLTFLGGGWALRLGFLLSLFGSNGVALRGGFGELLRDPALLSAAYEWIRYLSEERDLFSIDPLTHPGKAKKSGPTWSQTAAGFGWLSKFDGVPASIVNQFIILPFPRGPAMPPDVEPQLPLRGSCWCMPWGKGYPDEVASVLKAIHQSTSRRAFYLSRQFPFHALRSSWTDPAVRRRYPLYRHAAELVDGIQPVLFSIDHGYFRRLDVTFRNALLDRLDAAGWLSDFTHAQDPLVRNGGAPSLRIVLAGIESRLGHLRGINAIAAQMGLRADRLRRLFRKGTGDDVSAHLRKRRMDIAHALLEEGALSVKEVAARVGYRSPDSFGRAYRRYWGHVPRADRIAAPRTA